MHPSGENPTESFWKWGGPLQNKRQLVCLVNFGGCQIQGVWLDFFHPSGAGWLQHKAASFWCGGWRLMHHSDVSCVARQCAVWSFRPFSEVPRRTAWLLEIDLACVSNGRERHMALVWKCKDWLEKEAICAVHGVRHGCFVVRMMWKLRFSQMERRAFMAVVCSSFNVKMRSSSASTAASTLVSASLFSSS